MARMITLACLLLPLLAGCGSPTVSQPTATTIGATSTPAIIMTNTTQPRATPIPTTAPTNTTIPPTDTILAPTDTVPPLPTDTALPPTFTALAPTDAVTPPTETAVSVNVPVQSGGLGRDKAAWEVLYGKGEPGIVGTSFEDKKYDVWFSGDNSDGPARTIWVYYRPRGVDLDAARAEAIRLTPKDAELTKQSKIAESGSTITLLEYISPSLAKVYQDAALWDDAPPGTFYVLLRQYESENNLVPATIIDVGKYVQP